MSPQIEVRRPAGAPLGIGGGAVRIVPIAGLPGLLGWTEVRFPLAR